MKPRPLVPVLLATVVAAMTSACAVRSVVPPAAPGGTDIVLLPDAEGGATGRVTVSNASGTVDLTAPFDSTQVVANRPPSVPARIDESEIQRAFGSVLATLPPAAERFHLYFQIDSSDLTDKSQALLPVVLKAVANRVAPDVMVIGHTDTTGTSASNYRLGLKRAVSVRALLVSTGLDPSLVEVESHGEAELLVKTPNNTAEPRNRRVEITVQ